MVPVPDHTGEVTSRPQFRLSESVETRIPIGNHTVLRKSSMRPSYRTGFCHTVHLDFRPVLSLKGLMNESQTNSPSAIEAAPTSSLSGIEMALENTPPADEAATSAVDTPSSPAPEPSKAVEIFTWIKHTIGAQTHLSDANIAVAAFWVISTWFQEALSCFRAWRSPALPTEATELLRVLHELCSGSLLLAGFRRGDLQDVSRRTLLISEPNLNNQTAALFGKPHKPGIHDRGATILLILP
jgi:hypothetical protein